MHVSTDEVYGSLDAATAPTTETAPYRPTSPYAASKAASDHLARAWWHTYQLPVIISNCSNNFGPYQFPEKLIPHVILNAIQGKPIPIYGDGRQKREWLYVREHAEALIRLLENGKPGDSYNVGSGMELANIDLVRKICAMLDEIQPRKDGKTYAEQITFVADRPGHDQRYALDSSKIRQDLGWKPTRNFEENLRTTVLWYLENSDWWQRILNGAYKLERMGRKGN